MSKPTYQFAHGDCLNEMAVMEAESVDAIVTDPPYGLSKEPDAAEVLRHWLNGDDYKHRGGGFMGKEWDSFVPGPSVWKEAFRVLKPGGYMLVFGGTRTYDLLTIAIRLAGFEIRDSIHWFYGSGFPKSMDVAKAIDKAARGVPQDGSDPTSPNHGRYKTQGTEGKRHEGDKGQGFGAGPGAFMAEMGPGAPIGNTGLRVGDLDPHTGKRILGVKPGHDDFIDRTDDHSAGGRSEGWDRPWRADEANVLSSHLLLAADTPEAEQWQGWGTALKPAHEPIVLARKPFKGTVAANVLERGTGALNIDATRIGYQDPDDMASATPQGRATAKVGALAGGTQNENERTEFERPELKGRWPTNVILSHHEDCVQVGTKKVKGITGGYTEGSTGTMGAREGRYSPAKGEAKRDNTRAGTVGDDGMEEVAAWECVEGCPVAALDTQTGTLTSGKPTKRAKSGADKQGNTSAAYGAESRPAGSDMGDSGGASRFFYCAKTSRSERNKGLPEGMTNNHPTVKPVELMRYLVRLVTPPGGVVLDPYMGSGTTGVACVAEGFSFRGIENDTEHGYVEISQHRMRHALAEAEKRAG